MYTDWQTFKGIFRDPDLLWGCRLYRVPELCQYRVATGLMPNTGIPLPFVSYGLTSLVTLYMSIGFVLNVGLQPKNINGGVKVNIGLIAHDAKKKLMQKFLHCSTTRDLV